ncbi:MAG: hypothetical protein IPK64_15025 [bacterium]|nr:hypothetical protein [bacterium]
MRWTVGLAAVRLGLLAGAITAGAAGPSRAGEAAVDLPDTVVARLVDGARTEIVTVADLRAAARRRGLAVAGLSAGQARELLGTQLDRRALRLATAAEPPAWTPQDSAQHRDLALHLAFEAALDSAYAVERARRSAQGDTVTHPAVLGAAMRDRELARNAPSWDDAVVGRLAAAFAALPAPAADDDLVQRARKLTRVPAVAAADSDAVIATHAGNAFLVRDLLSEWRRLRALDRPHLEDVRQVKDFIGTALYRRQLRAQARPAGAPARPADAQRLQDQAEGFAATAWAVRHVFSQVPRDSVTLRREYDRDPSRWDLPAHAQIVRRHLSSREGAEALATRLRTHAGADSLAAHDRAQPDRVPDLVDERGDRALTERSLAAGPLGVVGPDSLAESVWRVVLVLEASPRRSRPFDEARIAVDRAWFDGECERRLRAALDGLRRRYGEQVDEAALARLAAEGTSPRLSPSAAPTPPRDRLRGRSG